MRARKHEVQGEKKDKGRWKTSRVEEQREKEDRERWRTKKDGEQGVMGDKERRRRYRHILFQIDIYSKDI